MLEWKVRTGDELLRRGIENTKATFDSWYNQHWSKKCTREEMLSENSPLEHVYYRMTKTFEEIKAKYPGDALKQCSSCNKYVDRWLETEFSFCDEYGCGMTLCKECATKLRESIDKL